MCLVVSSTCRDYSKYADIKEDAVQGMTKRLFVPAQGQGLGEELWGKPVGRLPLLHAGIGLQLLQQSRRGEAFRAGEGMGASPERQSRAITHNRGTVCSGTRSEGETCK